MHPWVASHLSQQALALPPHHHTKMIMIPHVNYKSVVKDTLLAAQPSHRPLSALFPLPDHNPLIFSASHVLLVYRASAAKDAQCSRKSSTMRPPMQPARLSCMSVDDRIPSHSCRPLGGGATLPAAIAAVSWGERRGARPQPSSRSAY